MSEVWSSSGDRPWPLHPRALTLSAFGLQATVRPQEAGDKIGLPGQWLL